MSPRQKVQMRIALPPRVNLALLQSSDSPLSSPGPHTPSPYADVCTPEINSSRNFEDISSDDEPVIGQKRAREEEEVEVDWTEEEMEVIQSTLIHPFRPISSSYPPGELPPPEVLDDLATQILQYAFKPHSKSPVKSKSYHAVSNHDRIIEATCQRSWKHGWDSTRKKLFQVALSESNFGKDDKERKMSRAERKAQRPGLRRMDSMDFLDQDEDNSNDHIGRAIRLSTTLQNTAKADPLLVAMTRAASGSTDLNDPMSKLSAVTPPIATITLTPPSPQPDAILPDQPLAESPISTPILHKPSAPPMRRRISNRSSHPRPARPSLLQRGRSFTASDLQAEIGVESPPLPGKGNTPSPIKEVPSPSVPSATSTGASSAPSADLPSPPSPSPAETILPFPAPSHVKIPRMTRSLSSITSSNHPPHSLRDAFLGHPPSIATASLLTQPAHLGLGIDLQLGSGGWSDSDDEGSIGNGRNGKSNRKIQNQRKLEIAISGNLPHLSGLKGVVDNDGLRSPFEERELQF